MQQAASIDVVGVGLNATDTLISLDTFPLSGDKVAYGAESVQPGGQVASAMVACQSWGLRTRYVGKVGDDDAGQLHEQAFLQAGVEAHLVRVPNAPSLKSLIFVDRQGERTVLNRRDPRLTLQPQDLRREWVTRARALLVDGHDTAAATLAASWAREAGALVVADLDEEYPELGQLLTLVDHLVVSRTFAQRLTGICDLPGALRALHQRGGGEVTAATLGAEGVLAWDGERFTAAAAFRVDALDTTGAGDVFHAGYLYGLLQPWTLSRRLDFACAAAALNCTGAGARGGIGSLAQVEALLAAGERYPAPHAAPEAELAMQGGAPCPAL